MTRCLALLALLGLSAAPARSTELEELELASWSGPERCWAAKREVAGAVVNVAVAQDPAWSLRFDYGVRRLSQLKNLGVVVANGTFFDMKTKAPLGDVIRGGTFLHRASPRRFKMKDGRLVDLDQRWGVGITLRGTLDIAQGDAAIGTMRDYLGGGGILLYRGVNRTQDNFSRRGVYGASFPAYVLTDKRGRTAVGLTGQGGLIVVDIPEGGGSGTDIRRLAVVMRHLGARDAVFYDGGDSTAFSAGPIGRAKDIYIPPSNDRDANPTHLVIRACR